MNQPKNDGKYHWTNHAKDKMRYYRISESLIKRIVRFPERVEEGIAPRTSAGMQARKVGGKVNEEIWVMWQEIRQKENLRPELRSREGKSQKFIQPKRRIISAWRYPGQSPLRGKIPIPDDVLESLENESGLKF